MDKQLVVIVGPTAVGKTDLCVALAEKWGTEVVSADARQLYREMQIGTARPTTAELRGVPHHFLGSHTVTDDYHVGQYEAEALALLDTLFARHDRVILTGGSGLYVRAVCDGLDAMPTVDAASRQQARDLYARQGLESLQRAVALRDPTYYRQADVQNPQRLMRALEVMLASGQPFSAFRTAQPQPRPFRVVKLGLTRARPVLYDRINQRVATMLAAGLVDEVRGLRPHRDRNALQTVGYREVFAYLDGEIDEAEMVRLLRRNTRRYAKRQLTWFRRDPAVAWLDLDTLADPAATIAVRIGP